MTPSNYFFTYIGMMFVTSLLIHLHGDFRWHHRNVYRHSAFERVLMICLWWVVFPLWSIYQFVKICSWAARMDLND